VYLRHGKKLCRGFDIRPGGHRPPRVPRLSLRAAMVTVAHGGQDGQPLRVTGGWFVLAVLRVCSRPGRPSSATKPDGAALAFAGMLRSMAARVKGSCEFHHRDVRLFSDTPAKLASSWNSMAAYRNHPPTRWLAAAIVLIETSRQRPCAGRATCVEDHSTVTQVSGRQRVQGPSSQIMTQCQVTLRNHRTIRTFDSATRTGGLAKRRSCHVRLFVGDVWIASCP
jgi:hypothetical protein